jgi:hypothetical protein
MDGSNNDDRYNNGVRPRYVEAGYMPDGWVSTRGDDDGWEGGGGWGDGGAPGGDS